MWVRKVFGSLKFFLQYGHNNVIFAPMKICDRVFMNTWKLVRHSALSFVKASARFQSPETQISDIWFPSQFSFSILASTAVRALSDGRQMYRITFLRDNCALLKLEASKLRKFESFELSIFEAFKLSNFKLFDLESCVTPPTVEKAQSLKVCKFWT